MKPSWLLKESEGIIDGQNRLDMGEIIYYIFIDKEIFSWDKGLFL
ncbi:MAG: hypothetical protein ACYSWP_24980 [Planctomycetota bacterium]